MAAKLSETALWQTNLASLLRSGLFHRVDVIDCRGLFAVVGVYGDGRHSAPLAKYADPRRAEDAMDMVLRLAGSPATAETN